jgi:hypothetical protein
MSDIGLMLPIVRGRQVRIGLPHGALGGGARADALEIGSGIRVRRQIARREDAHGRQWEKHDDVSCRELAAGEIIGAGKSLFDHAKSAIRTGTQQAHRIIVFRTAEHRYDDVDHQARHHRSIGEMKPV